MLPKLTQNSLAASLIIRYRELMHHLENPDSGWLANLTPECDVVYRKQIDERLCILFICEDIVTVAYVGEEGEIIDPSAHNLLDSRIVDGNIVFVKEHHDA